MSKQHLNRLICRRLFFTPLPLPSNASILFAATLSGRRKLPRCRVSSRSTGSAWLSLRSCWHCR
ncbi:unnamed protein product [Amoebophrya sp. A120]|nr:unnamed protein product [Amoebophrya sp. A120]|eukprot:GSA120T00014967001.1